MNMNKKELLQEGTMYNNNVIFFRGGWQTARFFTRKVNAVPQVILLHA